MYRNTERYNDEYSYYKHWYVILDVYQPFLFTKRDNKKYYCYY